MEDAIIYIVRVEISESALTCSPGLRYVRASVWEAWVALYNVGRECGKMTVAFWLKSADEHLRGKFPTRGHPLPTLMLLRICADLRLLVLGARARH